MLAPVGIDGFCQDYFEQAPLHLPNTGGVGSLFTVAELVGRVGEIPPGVLLIERDRWDKATSAEEYLRAGFPLVWSVARGASVLIDELCAGFGELFAAKVWPNIYATGPAATPFDMHFDRHEVIAVQCEGTKTWQISETRVNRPLEGPEMADWVAQALHTGRPTAARNIAMQVTTRPGDALYIPRGQFHHAWAADSVSLHVTFAIEPTSGYDIVKALANLAINDPTFRDYLPNPHADPNGERTRYYIQTIQAALIELITNGALTNAINTPHTVDPPAPHPSS